MEEKYQEVPSQMDTTKFRNELIEAVLKLANDNGLYAIKGLEVSITHTHDENSWYSIGMSFDGIFVGGGE